MDRLDFQSGDSILTEESQTFRENAVRGGIASMLSSYTADSLGFFITGAAVSTVVDGNNVTVSIAAGHCSFKGEPFVIEAHSIVRTVSEVAWLEIREEAVDSTPTNNNEGFGRSVNMKRTMALQKGSNFPAADAHMKLDAPTQLDLLIDKLSGRIMRRGMILEINPNDIPLISANWTDTGLGKPNTPAQDLALCNGLNGTIDKRHLSSVGATLSAFSVGAGPLATGVDSDNTYNPGDTFGEDKVTLTIDQMPEHSHEQVRDLHSFNGTGPLDDGNSYDRSNDNVDTSTAGGGQPHENRQPSIASVYVQVVA